MNVRDLLAEREAAVVLDINEATLRLWLKERTIPCYRLSRRKVRLARQDLEDVINRSRVAARENMA